MSRDLREVIRLVIRLEAAGAATFVDLVAQSAGLAMRQSETVVRGYLAWASGWRGQRAEFDPIDREAAFGDLACVRELAALPLVAFFRFLAELEALRPPPAPRVTDVPVKRDHEAAPLTTP
jgi:hypothetical protein